MCVSSSVTVSLSTISSWPAHGMAKGIPVGLHRLTRNKRWDISVSKSVSLALDGTSYCRKLLRISRQKDLITIILNISSCGSMFSARLIFRASRRRYLHASFTEVIRIECRIYKVISSEGGSISGHLIICLRLNFLKVKVHSPFNISRQNNRIDIVALHESIHPLRLLTERFIFNVQFNG